jgi:multidrug efflux pump subunit AcrB
MTRATIVAFLPLVFWPGIIGSFLRYMPIVLIYTLAASLVIAMFVVPALGAIFGRSGHLTPEAREQLGLAESGDLGKISGWTGRYLRVVTAAIDRPWITAGSVTGLLIAVFVAYGALGRGITLFPNVDPEQGSVDIRARGDLSTQEKDRLVRSVESRLLGLEGIKNVYVTSGSGNKGASPDQIGSISLNFKSWRERRPAGLQGLPPLRPGQRLVLVTGHRRENFGQGLENVCLALREIAERHPEAVVVYPVHLNPNVRRPRGRTRRVSGSAPTWHITPVSTGCISWRPRA